MPKQKNGQKLCNRCHTVQPLDNYYRSKANPDGLQYWCRDCTSKYHGSDRSPRRGIRGGRPKPLTAQEKSSILSLREGGCPVYVVAQMLSRSQWKIIDFLQEQGMPTHTSRRPWTSGETRQLYHYLDRGLSREEIAQELGRSAHAIRRRMNELGIAFEGGTRPRLDYIEAEKLKVRSERPRMEYLPKEKRDRLDTVEARAEALIRRELERWYEEFGSAESN